MGAFRDKDPLSERAVEQMLVGVSTRKYARSLEATGDDTAIRGTSKSAVSRRFVERTQQECEVWQTRSLTSLDIRVLMLDGVRFAKHTIIVALGVDSQGNKHILGIREGATENATVCVELLTDVRERGLNDSRSMLVVIDGAKALASAVRDVFGAKAQIQRCQVHKRNVEDHLPKALQQSMKKSMNQAYRAGQVATAKKALMATVNKLNENHPGAASSLLEGLDETLTVMGFKLPRALERTFSTTNLIENLIGSMRATSRRVKQWKDGQMIVRWAVASALEAEAKFRKVKGCNGMKKLIAVLDSFDSENTVVKEAKAA